MGVVSYTKARVRALLVGKSDVGHSHAQADVSGLVAALSGKQPAGSYAASVHAHAIGDVTGLAAALAAKQPAGDYAASVHTHNLSDVDGLEAELSARQPVGDYATNGDLSAVAVTAAAELATHAALTAAHGATAANTANRIVARGASGEVAVGAVAAGSVSVTAADPRYNVTATSPTSTPGVVMTNAGGEVGSLFVGGSGSSYPGLVGFYTSGSAGFAILSSGGTQLIRATQAGDVGIGTTSPAAKLDVAGQANVTGLKLGSAAARTTWPYRPITVTFDGGGSAPAAGSKIAVRVPEACTIVAATLMADASGSAVLDVKKQTYAQWLAGSTPTSVVASTPPTLSSARGAKDTTLTGWTTAVAADDVLEITVTSASTATRLTLALDVRY